MGLGRKRKEISDVQDRQEKIRRNEAGNGNLIEIEFEF